MDVREIGKLSVAEYLRLASGDRNPFGPSWEGVRPRPRDRHVVVRDDDGSTLASIGATIATVSVGDGEPFDVVGIGGLLVRPDARGRGVTGPLFDRFKELIESMGPDRAMLFCEAGLMPVYEGRGYARIDARVFADQPAGTVEMQMPAMWRALRPVEWPPGDVRVHGLPF